MAGKSKWMVAAISVGVGALVVLSLMEQGRYRFEVCVEFKGRTHCAKAAGATEELAVRAGQSIGCTLITSGRDENMACLAKQPVRVTELK